MNMKIPIIDCTDLYHPHQDPGDNFDLIAAYGLPEIDLRAIVLDVTERFRRAPHERTPEEMAAGVNPDGPREPGVIPVTQLNYIFKRAVPYGMSPFHAMNAPEDLMTEVGDFESSAIELILRTLREAEQPVDILIFCSCRSVAAAFNRDPELFRKKVHCIHLSVGNSCGDVFDLDWNAAKRLELRPGSPGYLEWNVELDPHAFVALLRSGLNLAIYPCACERGPFAMDFFNSYYLLPDLGFVRDMAPELASYLCYAFYRKNRIDFLRAMAEQPPMEELDGLARRSHHVWESAVWQCVSGRKLVHRADGSFCLLPPEELTADDHEVISELRNCSLEVDPTGRFRFKLTDYPTRTRIYYREDPELYARAMSEALARLYTGIIPGENGN